MITLANAKARLASDQVIQLSFVYSYRDRRFWRLLVPIDVLLSTGEKITIEAGYYTDLSSVPKWLWSIARPYGDFLLAALIHDWLYYNNIGTQKAADLEMFLWSQVLNDNELDNLIRYNMVRVFGKSWWNRAAARIALENLSIQLQSKSYEPIPDFVFDSDSCCTRTL